MAFSTLAYGGRGLAYFLYWGPTQYGGLYRDGKPMPVVADVAKLNAEISALSDVLMPLQSVGVYHSVQLPNGTRGLPANCGVRVSSTDPMVVGEFRDQTGAACFMIVSRNYRAKTTAFLTFTAAKEISEFSRAERKWHQLAVDGSKKQVAFEPGDGRLFRLR